MSARKIKVPPITGPQQVVQFLEQLEHPLKNEIQTVRAIILNADKQLTEQIKWNAPSFCYNGEDRITFNLKGDDAFRLIFHCGARVKIRPQKGRLFTDTTGLLNWVTDDRATATFTDLNDVQKKENALIAVVNKWLEAAC